MVPKAVLTLFLSECLLLFASYIAAAYFVIEVDPGTFLLYENGLLSITVVVAVILIAFYFQDLYIDLRIRSRLFLFQQLCIAVGTAFLSQAVISYIDRSWTLPNSLMIQGSLFALVALLLWRMLFSVVLIRAGGSRRVLLLGSSSVLFKVAHYLAEHPELGMSPIGYVDDQCHPEAPARVAYLGPLSDLLLIAEQHHPDRIVVGVQERRSHLPMSDLLTLRFSGIQTQEVAALYEATFKRVYTREIRPSHLVFSSDLGPSKHSIRRQTLYSFPIAAIGLVLTLPVMAIVALLIKLTSPGPILHRQVRVGLGNRTFTIMKFRSMYQDAEARTGAVWASLNDPRITPLGRWLRKLRLDELPQLFNVVRGDMSIVGPRPERPEFTKILSDQIPYYQQRHCVKPGITGWAQINYKYGDSIEDTIMKLEYDLYYIKHISLSLDLYIIFNTAKTIVLLRGAQ
jgi:sugar transferase (PEP-CTERM system associated)